MINKMILIIGIIMATLLLSSIKGLADTTTTTLQTTKAEGIEPVCGSLQSLFALSCGVVEEGGKQILVITETKDTEKKGFSTATIVIIAFIIILIAIVLIRRRS